MQGWFWGCLGRSSILQAPWRRSGMHQVLRDVCLFAWWIEWEGCSSRRKERRRAQMCIGLGVLGNSQEAGVTWRWGARGRGGDGAGTVCCLNYLDSTPRMLVVREHFLNCNHPEDGVVSSTFQVEARNTANHCKDKQYPSTTKNHPIPNINRAF